MLSGQCGYTTPKNIRIQAIDQMFKLPRQTIIAKFNEKKFSIDACLCCGKKIAQRPDDQNRAKIQTLPSH